MLSKLKNFHCVLINSLKYPEYPLVTLAPETVNFRNATERF